MYPCCMMPFLCGKSSGRCCSLQRYPKEYEYKQALRIRKYGCTAPVVLCYLIFNGVYDQALFVFPIDFHIDMVAPVARKHSLSLLSDLEDHTVNFAVPVYINKGIATKRSLIAHDDLGIVLSGRRSYRLYDRVMNKDRYNTADGTNR